MKKIFIVILLGGIICGCTPYESARPKAKTYETYESFPKKRRKQFEDREVSIFCKEMEDCKKQEQVLKLEAANWNKAFHNNVNDMVNFGKSLTEQQTPCWVEAHKYDRQNATEYRVAKEKFIDCVGLAKAEEWFSIDETQQELFRKRDILELKSKSASAKRQKLLRQAKAILARLDKDIEITRLKIALSSIVRNLR